MSRPTDTSGEHTPIGILLDIYERLGSVEEQNRQILAEQARASLARKEIYQVQESLIRRLDPFDAKDGISDRVKKMEPKVERVVAQLGLAALAISGVITGAIGLVWFVFTHMSDIVTVIRNFFGGQK